MTMLVVGVTIGGNLLAGKIASNRANDPRANIGSGTQPGSNPAAPIEINPVAGSTVNSFGDFEMADMLEPEEMDPQQAQLLAMLQEAGVDPEGLLSMAFGGAVQYKENGGGLGSLDFDKLMQDPELIKQLLSGANPMGETKVDFANLAPIDPFSPDAIEAQKLTPVTPLQDSQMDETVVTADYTEDLGDQTIFDELGYYADENPEMFTAGIGALSKVINAALLDVPERKGNIVSTQTLAGNSNRRRNDLNNITPIGGSKVTFANQGSTLQRPMFMPNGGQMRGPGGPKDDLIPVMASNGEYMLSKAAVDAAGNGSHAKGLANLEAFNKMGNKRYG